MEFSYDDLCKDKLMVINCRTEEIQKVIKEEIDSHVSGDYLDVKKKSEENGFSIAFCINNVNEIRIDVPDGWCIIDGWGEVVGAGGKYAPFLSIDRSVTELENTLINDIAEIRAMKYDVEYMEIYSIKKYTEMITVAERADEIYKLLLEAAPINDSEFDNNFNRLIPKAVEYSDYRSRWLGMSTIEQNNIERDRACNHDIFVDTKNDLGKYMLDHNMDITWTILLGEDRKNIGDFACYLSYVQGIKAR